MDSNNFIRADEVDVSVRGGMGDGTLPDEWERVHEEYQKPIDDGSGYYIYTFESEDFLVSCDIDKRDGETVHYVSLFKVKRDEESGERLTSLGTGVYRVIGVAEGKQAFPTDDADDSQFEVNREAHKEAEKAAFQTAVNLMRDVNSGKYDHKKFSEN
jgi:hypothetical protein